MQQDTSEQSRRVQIDNNYPVALLGIWGGGLTVLLIVSLWMTNGTWIYTLDDPYIHLSVAENILVGGYGINGGEFSSPSSSILYPLLLAVTEALGMADRGPLVINTLSMAAAVWILGMLLRDYVLKDYPLPQTSPVFFSILLGLGLCLTMNAWGLVSLGMEHSLHVLAVVLVLWQFVVLVNNPSAPAGLLILGIAILPLIRFEGLGLALFSLLALLGLGRFRAAFLAAGLVLAGLGGWYLFTHANDLQLLPSSVLIKSEVASSAVTDSALKSTLQATQRNIMRSLYDRQGRYLLFMMVVLAVMCVVAMRDSKRRKLALVVGGAGLATGLGQFLFGRYGWFSRYEVYAVSTVALACVILGHHYFGRRWLAWGSVIVIVHVALPYWNTTLKSPAASRGIYQQQYQLHRFATEYWQKPVAANDIGWMSYHNPEYVLDLIGLGSEKMRKLHRARNVNAKEMKFLLDKNQIELFVVYPVLERLVPKTWDKVARLETDKVTAAYAEVDFFLAPTIDARVFCAQMSDFKDSLPSGAALQMMGKCSQDLPSS